MFRIDNSTNVSVFPTIPPVGTPGYFTDGNPVSGVPATIVDDWWLNTVQEEIAHVIENAGITLDKFNHGQLWQAINSIIQGQPDQPDYDPYLPLVGGTIHNPGGADPLLIYADANLYARIRYTSGIAHAWASGVDASGNFVFTDTTANALRVYIDPTGQLIANGNIHGYATIWAEGQLGTNSTFTCNSNAGITGTLSVNGNTQINNNLTVTSSVYHGTRGIFINDTGNPQNQLGTNGGFSIAGQLNVGGAAAFNGTLGVGGNAGVGGQLSVTGVQFNSSDLHVAGTFYIGPHNYAFYDGGGSFTGIVANASFATTGNLQVNQNSQFLGQITVGGQAQFNAYLSGGQAGFTNNVTALGFTAQSFGITNYGNLRMIGGSAGEWITWESITDGSRPYAVSVSGDHWHVSDAAMSGGQMMPVNPIWTVMAGAGGAAPVVLADSGALAYKAGGGMWLDSSERRLKAEIEDYTTGLAAVCRLRPRSYLFNGRGGTTANGHRYVGLIADEVEGIMDEMLGQLQRTPAERVTTIDATALVYALCNSVRELAARVSTLEGRA